MMVYIVVQRFLNIILVKKKKKKGAGMVLIFSRYKICSYGFPVFPKMFLWLKVAIHYYGRLAAKQGWRFDSTYDHKDATGDPIPFVFTIGSGKVCF